eukprot:455982_1
MNDLNYRNYKIIITKKHQKNKSLQITNKLKTTNVLNKAKQRNKIIKTMKVFQMLLLFAMCLITFASAEESASRRMYTIADLEKKEVQETVLKRLQENAALITKLKKKNRFLTIALRKQKAKLAQTKRVVASLQAKLLELSF